MKSRIFDLPISGFGYHVFISRHLFSTLHTGKCLGSNEAQKTGDQKGHQHKGQSWRKKLFKTKKIVHTHTSYPNDPCTVTFWYRWYEFIVESNYTQGSCFYARKIPFSSIFPTPLLYFDILRNARLPKGYEWHIPNLAEIGIAVWEEMSKMWNIDEKTTTTNWGLVTWTFGS